VRLVCRVRGACVLEKEHGNYETGKENRRNVSQAAADTALSHRGHRLTHTERHQHGLDAQRFENFSLHAAGTVVTRQSVPRAHKMSAPSAPPEATSDDGPSAMSVAILVVAIVAVTIKALILLQLCRGTTPVALADDKDDPRPPGPREAFMRWARWRWRHRHTDDDGVHTPALLMQPSSQT